MTELSSPTSGDELLATSDLEVRYQGLHAVRGVDVIVRPGTVVAILGANGAGKTSLLRAIAGLVRPAAGRVHLAGRDITRLAAHRLPRRGLVLVPEGRELFPDLSVAANLRLGGFAVAGDLRPIESAVLDRFPVLRDKTGEKARSLSGGQQQMLAVARGLMSRPSVLLLDEPSLGLSPRMVSEVLAVVAGLRDEGRSVLLAEQNTEAAMRVADYVYVFRNGGIATEGTPDELTRDASLLREYLGDLGHDRR